MKVLIILLIAYAVFNRRSAFGLLSGLLGMVGGLGGGRSGGGYGMPTSSRDRPSDDYFRGYENWEREPYARELPREPGDEPY